MIEKSLFYFKYYVMKCLDDESMVIFLIYHFHRISVLNPTLQKGERELKHRTWFVTLLSIS